MGRRENRETYLYLYLSVDNAHLALELQAGLGDVHGERGTLREHGRGAREAELRREAFKAATGITTTHASRHGAVGVGCDAKIFDLELVKIRSLQSLVSLTPRRPPARRCRSCLVQNGPQQGPGLSLLTCSCLFTDLIGI